MRGTARPVSYSTGNYTSAKTKGAPVILAIFDLDNTLLDGDSDHAWGQFLVDHGLVDGPAYERDNQRYYELYRNGQLDILEFLNFALAPLAAHERGMLEELRTRFVEERIQPMITAASRALIAAHRAQGHVLLIMTATNRFVTEPIVAILGIDNLIATDPEEVSGRFTGRVAGTPCFREGKVERLQAWIQARGLSLAESWFYSDSHNDLPLLNLVTHPVAVNPDSILKQYANTRGWPILDLRAPLLADSAHP